MSKKISMQELDRIFWDFNRDHDNGEGEDYIRAVIVYKQENWKKPYSEESRSYNVCSNNRRWQDGKIANSYYGSCLDGTDDGVRLDWYNWDVDYCYLLED